MKKSKFTEELILLDFSQGDFGYVSAFRYDGTAVRHTLQISQVLVHPDPIDIQPWGCNTLVVELGHPDRRAE